MPHVHAQLDVEALGDPGKDCPVTAIAVVPFAGFQGPIPSPYQAEIKLPPTFRVCGGHLRWWLQQPPQVQAQIRVGGDGKAPSLVAFEFMKYAEEIRGDGRLYLWATAREDFAWLDEILATKNTSLRDLKIRPCDAWTIYRLAKVRPPALFPGKHVAINDATEEARTTLQAGNILNLDWGTFGDTEAPEGTG